MRKKLLCLANSTKYDGRCVAGVDIETGEWVRPVSDREHGELRANHWCTDRAYEPRPLDMVSVPLREPTPEPHHPENWSLAEGDWRRLERGLTGQSTRVLKKTLHTGPDLFGDCKSSIDYDTVTTSPVESSLELIRPETTALYRHNYDESPRVEFQLSGETYEMALTDPNWDERVVKTRYPASHYLDDGQTVLLTISLGEEYERTNACHKIAAALIPVSEETFS
jgi:hypothetical protein